MHGGEARSADPGATSAGPERVVAGVLVEHGRVLLAHRSPSRRWYPDVWDLPGGHLDPGETGRSALARELREELGVEVIDAHERHRVHLDDAVLALWVVVAWSGAPENRAPEEHDSLRWFASDELPVDELAHADLEPVLREALAASHPCEAGAPDGDPGRPPLGA